MCGRFFLLTDLSVIVESFGIQEVACDYRPDHNLSPGREIPAVVHEGRNCLVGFRWGLIPAWARDPLIGNRMFNARAETIAEKPSFRDAFRKRRCLIPAEGFYEWQRDGKVKKPFRFSLQSGKPFGFAGLHEIWISPEKKTIRTCTIITTEANELIQPIHDRMPVILLTAHSAVEDRIRGLEMGADDYLSKPFSPKELLLRLRGVLRRNAGDQATLNQGPFRLERDTLRLEVDGARVDLTATEFKLIYVLMTRVGQVQGRDQLLRDVWGYKDSTLTRTLDTHVKRLREKLGAYADRVQTVRGIGYVLQPGDPDEPAAEP